MLKSSSVLHIHQQPCSLLFTTEPQGWVPTADGYLHEGLSFSPSLYCSATGLAVKLWSLLIDAEESKSKFDASNKFEMVRSKRGWFS